MKSNIFSSKLRMLAGIQQQRLSTTRQRRYLSDNVNCSSGQSTANFTPSTIIGFLRIRTCNSDKSVQASNRHSTVCAQVEHIITWGPARRFSCWLWPPACTCSSPWPSGSWRRPARLPSRPSCAEGSHAIRTRTRRASVPTNSTVDWRFDGSRKNTIPR